MHGPGLFGKVPETGDFIARGLAPGLRGPLDRWVTAHLAARREGWPPGGVRGLLVLDACSVLFVAVASADSVGRRYPLLAVTSGLALSLQEAEAWCDAAVELVEKLAAGGGDLDGTQRALKAIEPALRDGPDGYPSLWIAGGAPAPCGTDTLNGMFSSG